eukprot:TRINITY_DN36591_c0_g1_i1.p1 TRINITY_DN36591_c0_g1~~TRINITY_DN36591_c0_g1_i1.p1  ORF type:complete len:338 (-),score=51.31 TRINITY_DN36591_c0_g1_i1:138-1103(-)
MVAPTSIASPAWSGHSVPHQLPSGYCVQLKSSGFLVAPAWSAGARPGADASMVPCSGAWVRTLSPSLSVANLSPRQQPVLRRQVSLPPRIQAVGKLAAHPAPPAVTVPSAPVSAGAVSAAGAASSRSRSSSKATTVGRATAAPGSSCQTAAPMWTIQDEIAEARADGIREERHDEDDTISPVMAASQPSDSGRPKSATSSTLPRYARLLSGQQASQPETATPSFCRTTAPRAKGSASIVVSPRSCTDRCLVADPDQLMQQWSKMVDKPLYWRKSMARELDVKPGLWTSGNLSPRRAAPAAKRRPIGSRETALAPQRPARAI